ncbi:ATP-binding protein [Posidoniimonas polymericola]|uniref:ATP-binding protein n=1 Tax=Posidoniimonas polymericola TaxID=2528002 RepID=UPI0011B67A5C|nr:ATP-binding protein [Posidoniimonas polymericola]
MSSNTRRVRRSLTRGPWLTVLYVSALSTVALLTCCGQWLVQRQLVNGESDSRVVNIAGRQRMLSQRLAKSTLRLAAASYDAPADRRELSSTLALWSRSHEALQHGDAEIGLPGDNSAEIQRLFGSISPYYRALRSSTLTLLDASSSEAMRRRAVEQVQAKEKLFLEGMDAIVSQYVLEAEEKVARLRSLEAGILMLTLAVLAAEGLIVFRPAVRQIERTLNRLSRTSRRLRSAKLRAEDADAAKSRFLANVSHELRTPMTAVLGMTELARSESDAHQRDEQLKTVSQSGELLLGLLNDLIDFARIDSGKLELVIQPFSPYEVLDRVIRMMQPACAAKGLKMVPIVGVDKSLRVLGDARRLEQVLLNLISNAIKWTTDGAVSIRCENAAPRGSLVTLSYSVQDTGAGISREHHRKVFEPFTQVAGDKSTAQGGVGLGLAICKRIADAMGAELVLTSRPEVGTTVRLTCDFCVAPRVRAPAASTTLVGVAEGLRALVVEDTEVIQPLFRGHLRRLGCRTTVVGTGEDGVLAARHAPFDIAFVDLQLPGIDGVATAEELRRSAIETGRPIRVVCVTADARSSLGDERINAVFDSVLIKPFQRDDLASELMLVHPPLAETLESGTGSDPDADMQRELTEVYLSVAEQQESSLANAVTASHWSDARVITHRLAGQVAYFENPELVERLRQLEHACETCNAGGAVVLAEECLQSLAGLREQLLSKAMSVT